MSDAGPMLVVSGLGQRFGDLVALEDFALEVPSGAWVALLGPNGSGKSTALALIAGLLPITAGRVTFDGLVHGASPTDVRVRAAIGVVFQSPSLDPKLSVAENLGLCALIRGLSSTEGAARIAELTAALGVADRMASLVAELSGGLRRRVDLARALLARPSILLLDEPSAGLDESAFRRLWEFLVQSRARDGLTVLVATHRPEEAELCDRIVVIDGGKKVAEDTPDALKRRVSGDLVILESDRLDEVQSILAQTLGLSGRRSADQLVLESEAGHRLVPRLAEALPAGLLRAISVRRPSLADVFVKLTGSSLAA